MPDIDINVNLPKARVFFSKTIEVISCIQLLAIPNHHEFALEFANALRKELNKEDFLLLDEIAKFPFHGIELYEYILAIQIYDDVDLFVDKLLALSDEEIIEIFVMKHNNRELIKKILNKALKDSEIEEQFPYSYKESIHEIGCILFNTNQFKINFASLIKKIGHNPLFNEKIRVLSIQYQDSINNYTNQLMVKKPLDLGQAIMNKTFKNVFPYKEFYFSPSYFVSPHRLRVHNEKVNHVIYDLRRDHLYLNQVGNDISIAMKILSDRTRLEILRQLCIAPTYGKMLANALDLTTATISHHLDLLKSINLIIEEKQKNIKYYRVNKEEVDKLFSLIDRYINNKL